MRDFEFIRDADDARKSALEVLEKSEDEIERDVEILKQWLQTQKHLPEIMKDSHVRNFLLINKGSIENTKRKIDMYYTIRTLLPEFYDHSNPKLPKMKKCLDNMNLCVFPKLIKGVYRVYFFKFKKPDILSPEETIMTLSNLAEIRLHEDYFIHDAHVVDFRNITFNDVMKCTPSIIIKGLTIYEKVYSFRFKKCYIINASPYISKVLAICKTILKPKIFERIIVSDKEDILSEIFSEDTLPKDYGGSGPSLDHLTEVAKSTFEEYQNRFDDLDRMRVDESLRMKPLENDETLGFHGNFKKLNVLVIRDVSYCDKLPHWIAQDVYIVYTKGHQEGNISQGHCIVCYYFFFF